MVPIVILVLPSHVEVSALRDYLLTLRLAPRAEVHPVCASISITNHFFDVSALRWFF